MEEKKTKKKRISLFLLLAVLFFAASGIVLLVFALNGDNTSLPAETEAYIEEGKTEPTEPEIRVVNGIVEYFDGEKWVKTESLEAFLADDLLSSVAAASISEDLSLPPERAEGDTEKPKKTGGSSGGTSSGGSGTPSAPAETAPSAPPAGSAPATPAPDSGGLVDTGAEESGDYL